MNIAFRSVPVAAREQGGGSLVLVGGWLVAVLVRLSDQHGPHSGQWFLETGYGRFAGGEQPIFPDLAQARHWFAARIADRTRHDLDPWERERG